MEEMNERPNIAMEEEDTEEMKRWEKSKPE